MMKLFKHRKVTRLALSGAVLMALFTGCEYEYIQEPELPPITTELKFSTDIVPIFNEKCNNAGCHSAGGIAPDLSPANAFNSLTTGGFINTETPAASELYTVMSTGSMKSFSTAEYNQKVLTWIEQGAKNN